MPFRDAADLSDHFRRHGAQFPHIGNEQDYLQAAEAFLNGPIGANTLECNRPQGGRVRYDTVTQEYAVVRADGTIATYFKPDPAVHLLASNMVYYERHCL